MNIGTIRPAYEQYGVFPSLKAKMTPICKNHTASRKVRIWDSANAPGY